MKWKANRCSDLKGECKMNIGNSRELRCAYESMAIWNELLADSEEEQKRRNEKIFEMVRNSKTLRDTAEWIEQLTIDQEATSQEQNRIRERIKELKRDIREYNKRPESEEVIVRDYGIDGFVIRKPLPDFLKSIEDAVEYFEENEYMRCRPSMYDCTGDLFTSWYKIYKKDGRIWCYHSISVDV